MALCLTLFLIVAIILFYYQAVIFPALVLHEKVKLYDLVDKLNVLKTKNTISFRGHQAVKAIILATVAIFASHYQLDKPFNDDETFDGDTEFNKNLTNDDLMSVVNSKNLESKRIIADWYEVLLSVDKESKYPWLLYFLPILFSGYLTRKLFKLISSSSENLTKKIFPYSPFQNQDLELMLK